MSKNFYAHSLPGQPPKKWQKLEDHLRNVAEMASQFASSFDSADWGWNAGMLHDIGKADEGFQAYLKRSNGLDDSEYDDAGRVNHSSAGAALAEEQLKLAGRIQAYISAGHHAGLPDWYSSETGNAALEARLIEGRDNLSRIRTFAESKLADIKTAIPPDRFRKPEYYHLWVRMLYSCLVDADFLDTEAFMNSEVVSDRKGFQGLSDFNRCFDSYMADKITTVPKTEVNKIRQLILYACVQAAVKPSGLFSLSVPTGGGKTLSSMAFALEHAAIHKKSRIIYVIPYTSIIEQTAGIFREIFGDDNVVEHHSNLDPEKETQRSRLASENWDAPIIVTTNVQFFESLYAAKSSRCRKLHNVVNSVVVLDEAQLVPPGLIEPCVDIMNQLVKNFAVTIVLSTATQPLLPKLDKPTEIIPDDLNLYNRLKRVEYCFSENKERIEWPVLANELQKHEQALCIVNTRRDCYDLFKIMPAVTFHLSALMCGAHRSRVIKDIKDRVAASKPVRVISTQLVEAGVDIDFPVVYRAMTGFDSIAQAAGRCNREGKLKTGKVTVFLPPKSVRAGTLLKGEQAASELLSVGIKDLSDQSVFKRYFDLFYPSLNDRGGKKYSDLLVKNAYPELKFQFRTAGQEFKIIDDKAQMPVIVRYGESEELIKKLRFAGPTREIMRKLQRYTVNLARYTATKMIADGLLEEIAPVQMPGIVVQAGMNIYNDKTGLDIFKDSLPPEDLVC